MWQYRHFVLLSWLVNEGTAEGEEGVGPCSLYRTQRNLSGVCTQVYGNSLTTVHDVAHSLELVVGGLSISYCLSLGMDLLSLVVPHTTGWVPEGSSFAGP